jgi:hypothetical protein
MKRDYFQNGVVLLPLFLVLTSLLACSHDARFQSANDALSTSASKDVNSKIAQPDFCGGKLSGNGVFEFLSALKSDIRSENSSSIRDGRLYADNITLIADGKVERVSSEQLPYYSGRLPTREDWKTISSLLASGNLFPVGWRGCILSNGKAAFVTNSAGSIRLSSFNFDQEWER